MTTIRLDVNNKAINKVMQFLKAFDSDEVIIINKDQNYLLFSSVFFVKFIKY